MRPLACLLLSLLTFAGCSPGSAPLPSSTTARQSLQTALDAWKAGKPPTSLSESEPKIEIADFEWKGGKALVDYSLKEGEEGQDQGTRTFSASLRIKGESAPKDVKYMVLGSDPVRIYRDVDFTRAMNMDDNPPASKKKGR